MTAVHRFVPTEDPKQVLQTFIRLLFIYIYIRLLKLNIDTDGYMKIYILYYLLYYLLYIYIRDWLYA